MRFFRNLSDFACFFGLFRFYVTVIYIHELRISRNVREIRVTEARNYENKFYHRGDEILGRAYLHGEWSASNRERLTTLGSRVEIRKSIPLRYHTCTVVFDDFGTITCIAWCVCGRRPGSRSPRVPRTLGYLWRLLADFEHRLRPEFFLFSVRSAARCPIYRGSQILQPGLWSGLRNFWA